MTEYVIKPTSGPHYLPDTYALLRVDHCKGALVEHYGTFDYVMIQFRNIVRTGDTLRVDKSNPEVDALESLTYDDGRRYVGRAWAEDMVKALHKRGYKIVKDET